MKIAFLCDLFPNAEFGGVESITASLAKEFKRLGHECYCIYQDKYKEDETYRYMASEIFTEVIYIPHSNIESCVLYDFIKENEIKITVVQSARTIAKSNVLREGISAAGSKVVAVLHCRPGYERLFLRETMTKWRFKTFGEFFKRLKDKLFFDKRYKRGCAKLACHIGRPVVDVDKYVLLSRHFIPLFIDMYGVPEEHTAKITAIDNCLRFDNSIEQEDIGKKEKEVLVVSRLHELVKNLSTVLYAWKKIQDAGKTDEGWRLTIVGHGPDEQMYKELAKKLNLKNVSFEGRQDPEKYYRRASIFTMTSISEGWGMTLLESHQSGVVPIALDTYESLHDIITDGYNGMIVPPNDMDAFVAGIIELMDNEERRRQMAQNAVESSRRFTPEIVANKWLSMFEDMLKS